MLQSFTVKNFEAIEECKLYDLGKVNVFIGRNNSGKSSILEALCVSKSGFNPRMFNEPVLGQLLRRRGMERRYYTCRNFWHNTNPAKSIIFNLDFGEGGKLDLEVRWGGENGIQFYASTPDNRLARAIENRFYGSLLTDINGNQLGGQGNWGAFENTYPSTGLFFRELLLIDDYLARKLERLETAVFGRILEPRLDKEIVKYLNEAYDLHAEGFSYIPASPGSDSYRLAVTTEDRSAQIDELGDGSKYATILLSVCILLENSAFLIEEIESHQHSGAIEKVLPSLVAIATKRNVQLFLTTHSLDVLRILSNITGNSDVKFFHVERSRDGKVVTRPFSNVDVKLLTDMGVDLRYLEHYRKFIVVEGKEDRSFLAAIIEKHGRRVSDMGYLVEAGNKDLVNSIAASLVPTGRQIITAPDYDARTEEQVISSLSNTLDSRNLSFTREGKTFRMNDYGSSVTVMPLGLPGNGVLGTVGIDRHEMEDYCLEILEKDEETAKWANISLKSLAEDAKKANFPNRNRSKTLLQTFSNKKGISYEEAIKSIIEHANRAVVDAVIGELAQIIPA